MVDRGSLASVIGGGALALTAAATAQQVAIVRSPTADRYRIDRPAVNAPWTRYPTVTLRPGDVMTITADGCVQTGGHGATWKRFVNPSGNGSDNYYHGRVSLPSVLDPSRIQNIQGREITIPRNASPSDLVLQIGYEDDDYSDNSYADHDDGTENQCAGIGPAWVEIGVTRDAAPPLPTPEAIVTCGSVADLADRDGDGLSDGCEQFLAEKFAPIVFHSLSEPAWPTNVDWVLRQSQLWFYDDACTPDLKRLIVNAPTQSQLLGHSVIGECDSTDIVTSDGTRSDQKQRTFYIADVPDGAKPGSPRSEDWTTYFHAYRSSQGGVTVQYWRFYAFNDGPATFNHGGDWEGIHVVLGNDQRPAAVGFLGHETLETLPAASVQWSGDHPVIFSEPGGHTSRPNGDSVPEPRLSQESWSGGSVTLSGRPTTRTGPLVNLGERRHPLNGQVFLRYSGLWGDPGTFTFTSGYWGPAFNETSMRLPEHFITAWCNGMRMPPPGECVPTSFSR